MYFIPFAIACPELAANETRSLTVFKKIEVPMGYYSYVEMFCSDPECDCHLVRFMVLSNKGKTEAILTYGWKDRAFYDKAFYSQDHNFPGPDFAIMEPQGPHAHYFLSFCKTTLLKDPDYVKRLQRHYHLFKAEAKKEDLMQRLKKLEAESKKKDLMQGLEKPEKIQRNDSCPCGSGSKYKHCCL